MRRLALFVALGAAACTCGKREGGVEAHIDFVGFQPGCLEVIATDVKNGANTSTSGKVPVTARRTYVVAVALKPGWSHTLKIDVVGYEKSCGGKEVARTSDGMVDVPLGEVTELPFTLTATDIDGDGWVARDAGNDCDDGNANAAPGKTELCANGFDDDCNGKKDCEDGVSCPLLTECAVTGPCRPTPGRCQSVGCVQTFAASGTVCGTGMKCRDDGICVDGNTELNCNDGLDDDNDDAGFDCGDSDCNAAACDAGNCRVNGRCGGGVCMSLPKDCGPASGCHDAGVCNMTNNQCDFPPLPMGTPCDDADKCTSTDRCNATGVCAGTFGCTATGCGAAFCDAGNCDVAPMTGGPCNDGMACTRNDMCSGMTCTGTSYSCIGVPAPVCQLPNGCDGDGGCLFAPVGDGFACDGGRCVAGSCLPDFGYAPSNVVPSMVPPAGDVSISCRVLLDTTDGGASSWCDGGAPAIWPIVQAGSSEPALVLSMNKLSMPASGTLRAVGSRPLIILVWDKGTTTIDGVIDARSTRLDAGAAGSDRPGCGLQAGQPGVTGGSSRGSGGGGGGFATGGSRGAASDGDATLGGDGGVAVASALSPLIGGCPGGRGGPGMGTGGTPGSGGGAFQVSVAGTLRVGATARLTVSGAGGHAVPTNTRSGGGGGGSAGMLLLEADLLTLSANPWLTANGGAGAEAADDNDPGDFGDDGSFLSTNPAAGGSGSANNGSDGADGAAGATPPGTAQPSKDCGGGGGGAVGRIHLRAKTSCTRSTNSSPPATHDGGCL